MKTTIKNTDLVLTSKNISDEDVSYNVYDILIPLDYELIESICGAQYQKKYNRITSNGDYIQLTNDELSGNQISIKRLIELKIRVAAKILIEDRN
jgi:hypothetical protein